MAGWKREHRRSRAVKLYGGTSHSYGLVDYRCRFPPVNAAPILQKSESWRPDIPFSRLILFPRITPLLAALNPYILHTASPTLHPPHFVPAGLSLFLPFCLCGCLLSGYLYYHLSHPVYIFSLPGLSPPTAQVLTFRYSLNEGDGCEEI
jgi:hypothetical protein